MKPETMLIAASWFDFAIKIFIVLGAAVLVGLALSGRL